MSAAGWQARLRDRGTLLAAGLLIGCWLLEITHQGLPRRLSQWALAAALMLGSWWLLHLAARLWRGDVLDRSAGRFLVLTTALALVVQAIGLGHEIGNLYFGDEGWFLAEAKRINAERPMRPWFVYPHFLFYWDAFALWLADLCGPVAPALARRLWGVEGELNVSALVTRCASATLAALAVVPTFLGARRLWLATGENRDQSAAAARAGLGAALLLALSPTMVEVGHLNLADVPAAFWSACATYGVVLLLERETLRRYLFTGAAAGLAAASKYPAGVVAVAIIGVWARGVAARRRPNAAILWAGLAAIGAFVVAMPSILRWPEVAFVGGEGRPDILFGLRLYGVARWHGVVRASNVLYYVREAGHAFGWPAILLGLAGLATLTGALRRRLAWMLPFPIAHLALLCAMAVAVRRNLMPLMAFFAIALGSGLAGAYAWAAARWRRPAAIAVFLAAFLVPAAVTALMLVRQSAPTTRDAAAAWLSGHLPPGSFLVQEQYTPLVVPEPLYPARKPRFAARLELPVLRDPRHDYLLLSSEAYQRFFDQDNLERLANDAMAARYREIFATWPLVREWVPGTLQDGPTIRLYRVDPARSDFATSRRIAAADSLTSHPAMKTADGAIAFTSPGQWALFKTDLAAGSYRVLAESGAGDGRLRLRTREDEHEAATAISGGEARIAVPRDARVFLYVELAPGSRLTSLTIGRE